MSTQVPVLTATIANPTDDPASLVQAVVAIKQIVQTDHGLPLGKPRHVKSAVNIALDAAIRHVSNA